ncbi:hypothetical protein C8T65DRAFT_655549 [Cerioporus squamosus]|nr:hypothetical protein C8T65DRAFT_655549 [Cerioporus squamosus]
MLLTELAVVGLAIVGLSISTFKHVWSNLFRKVSLGSIFLTIWREDRAEPPLPRPASGTRPDTSFPVFDKTPGDDPFVRDEFIRALVNLARQHLDPVEAQQYHAMILSSAADAGPLGCAMVPQHERHRPTQPSSSRLWGRGPAPPTRPTPVPAARPLARQNAFSGAWNADTFFNPVWWLNPRMESASSSGPALEEWMHSVRIVKGNYGTVDYGATTGSGPVSVEANWRTRFRHTFPGFDILQPGEDASQSTRWPGSNA